MYPKFFKRLIDVVISAILLLLLSPVLIIIYLSLLISYKVNPFFFQERVGKNNKVFTLMKFKSMTDERDANGVLLADCYRLTAFGRFLRKSSLDELPQLINVLKGDMSLIGPRPLFEIYLPYYTPEEQIRHNVRPGISGWAQVNGRNVAAWDTRLALDIYYVKNLSFKLDCLIVVKTIVNILSAKDLLIDETNQTPYLSEERKFKNISQKI